MRFLLNLLTFHLLLGLAFIVGFQQSFQYSPSIVILHELLLFTVATLILFPGFYLSRRNNTKALYAYILIILPLFDLTLLLIYSSTVISNILWSGNITLQLITAYIVDIDVMMQTLPALKLYLLTLPFSLIVLIYAYRQIFRRFYFDHSTPYLPEIKIAAYYIFAVVSLAFLLQISFDREDPGIWSGEPLSNLFLDFIPMFEYDPSLPDVQVSVSASSEQLAPRAGFQNKNIVVIMVDALRADHLKAYEYQRDTTPFLTGLHDRGELLKIEMMHSTCSESACGILSVLTGREFDDIKSNSVHLGDILKSNGYVSSFIVTGNHAWGGLRTMYNADYFRDGQSRDRYSVNDDAGILDDLQNLQLSDTQPNFVYIHLYSAHDLGLRHRQFNQFEPHQPPFNPLANLFSSESERHQLEINNYDNGIVQADYFIAQIFSQLEQKNILQNSVVYITADHGQAFGEHGHYGHTRFLYEEHIRVPLFIYDQDLTRYQNTEYAKHIDIAPTILNSLALQSPTDWSGHSLLSASVNDRFTFHRSTIANGWKLNLFKNKNLIYKHLWEGESYDNRNQELLFEITSDPGEQTNLLDSALGQEIVEEILLSLKDHDSVLESAATNQEIL